MNVTKEAAQAYAVRNDYESARIFIQSGSRPEGDGPRTWGYISVVSSFGSFGAFFSHCGRAPFEQFLADCDCHYLMGKLMGTDVRVFDREATAKSLRRLVISKRWERCIEKAEARELLDAIEAAEDERDRDAFMYALRDACAERFWEWELYEHAAETLNPQARGFWEQLWRPFVAEVLSPSKAAA